MTIPMLIAEINIISCILEVSLPIRMIIALT
jgi:hypothetical protein